MWTEYMFVILSYILIKGEVSRAQIWFNLSTLTVSSISSDRSKAVPLLQFFFLCASVAAYVAFVLILIVPHLFPLLVPF